MLKSGEAIILSVIKALNEKNSWSGETHVQKAVFFLQELGKADLVYPFILYKYGPFSFELRDDLIYLRARGLLLREILSPNYGPRLLVSDMGKDFLKSECNLDEKDTSEVISTVDLIGKRGVKDLEALATALYVVKRFPSESDEQRARRLREFKPHIKEAEAEAAIREAITMCKVISSDAA